MLEDPEKQFLWIDEQLLNCYFTHIKKEEKTCRIFFQDLKQITEETDT